MQPAVGQGTLDNAVSTHPPVALAAARRQVHLRAWDAQREQVTAARWRLFPLFPVVQAHASSDPVVQFQQFPIGVAGGRDHAGEDAAS